MRSVMLYFGSFNPIHNGHIAVAEWVLEQGLCNELWFVVSPRNPLKDAAGLIDEEHRLKMVALSISYSRFPDRMRACDIEFDMPRPSYTIDTLTVLSELYADMKFSVLVGSDIVDQITRWKEWSRLLDEYDIYVYPRRGYALGKIDNRFKLIEGAPFEDYSSTQVRGTLAGNRHAGMVPQAVEDYINEHKLWKTTEK